MYNIFIYFLYIYLYIFAYIYLHNQNRTIILSFKKAVVYILSTKKYDIRKWRQVEFKKGL